MIHQSSLGCLACNDHGYVRRRGMLQAVKPEFRVNIPEGMFGWYEYSEFCECKIGRQLTRTQIDASRKNP